jgi:ABC-type nitrate/sulfonate/bicarbonate transport system permease component
MITFVIWFGTLWPLLLNSIYGAQGVHVRHREISQLLRLTKLQTLFLIVLPTAVPHIFAGIRIAISIALILAVTAEMLAGQNGLGFWLLDYERAFRYREMYAILVILGVVGLLINIALVKGQDVLGRRFPALG